MARAQNVEKVYGTKGVVAKLRRLADALEAGESFAVQIAGERVHVPPDAQIDFEYECDGTEQEVEISLTWKRKRRSERPRG